ncbi:hypothetical protein NDU88_001026 [Pleurodeles waltl]|uniref:Uncharacterized protein n=1 Tax=Pleurodeles waltl TaxID=8319 RepID=A0AAV7SY41_PLEWA|nr:hypothetical protein NDU88_001026 [Pleurodeles waltl]
MRERGRVWGRPWSARRTYRDPRYRAATLSSRTATQWSRLGARRPGGETTRWGGKERGTYCFIGRPE